MTRTLQDQEQLARFPRVLMISTGHLSARTARFLRDHDASDWPVLGGHYGDVGFMLWVDEGASGMAPNLPHDLSDVFEYAAKQEAVIVIFQDVSPVAPGLATYRNDRSFEAEEFLNRTKTPWDAREDDAAEISLGILSVDNGFQATPIYLVNAMSQIVGELLEHVGGNELSAFSHDRLQALSDMASVFRLCAKMRRSEFNQVVLDVDKLANELDRFIDKIGPQTSGPGARNREALEDVQFRLDVARKLLKQNS